MDKFFDKTTGLPLDQSTQGINKAFEEQRDITEAQAKTNQDAIDRIRGYITACEGETRGTGCEAGVLDGKRKEAADLAAQNVELKKQMDQLAAAQVALKPPPTVGCETTKTCPGDTRRDPAPPTPPPGGPSGGTPPPGGNNTGFNPSALTPLLSALAKAMGTQPPPQAPPPAAQQCATDPNAYAQQQQQYQQAQQQYNYQLQQYQYQQQLAQYNSNTYGGQSYAPPQQPQPAQPQPCTPSNGQQCTAQPAQPPASSCTVGYWKPTFSGVCITNWQCTSTEQLKAEISCQPKVADAGMTLAISYSCSSGTASSTAFQVTTQPSGSATTTVAAPPVGTNTATYNLNCTDGGKTAGAQCSIQVGKPSIILVGNPKTVPVNGASLLGWITTGMKSCVVSSPDQADFTTRNSSNTSPNGTATTSPIASQALFFLRCETLAGGTKEATTTISVTP